MDRLRVLVALERIGGDGGVEGVDVEDERMRSEPEAPARWRPGSSGPPSHGHRPPSPQRCCRSGCTCERSRSPPRRASSRSTAIDTRFRPPTFTPRRRTIQVVIPASIPRLPPPSPAGAGPGPCGASGIYRRRCDWNRRPTARRGDWEAHRLTMPESIPPPARIWTESEMDRIRVGYIPQHHGGEVVHLRGGGPLVRAIAAGRAWASMRRPSLPSTAAMSSSPQSSPGTDPNTSAPRIRTSP